MLEVVSSQPLVIVSPHLDDAILSCFRFANQSALVVNVFDALPLRYAARTPWDDATGSTSPRQRMVERKAEDRQAMQQTLWTSRGLGLYRPNATAEQILVSVNGIIQDMNSGNGKAKMLIPAGIGGHPGHVLVRDSLLSLAGACDLSLYADIPYAVGFAYADLVVKGAVCVQKPWLAALDQVASSRYEIGPIQAHILSTEVALRKKAAVALYQTQVAQLDTEHAGAASDAQRLAIEVTWPVRSKA